MLTNVTLKIVALTQMDMYAWLNDANAIHSDCKVKLAAFAVCTIDVLIDTLKYPVFAIEKIAMAAINLFGACCSKNYSLSHAWINFKKAVFLTFVATPVMTLLFPLKLFAQYCRAIPDPMHANPSNREAQQEVQTLQPIVGYA